jgi:uncharacterized protein (TIGR02246 family)
MTASRFPLILSVLVLAACPPAPIPDTSSQTDSFEAEVREAVEQLTEAMNARDADRVLAFYRESREFVFVGCTDLMFGSDIFSRVLGPYWESRADPPVEREILRVQVLNPETAVVTLQGGSQTASALFWTQILVREEDGRWLIAHEHQSWPGCREAPRLHSTGNLGDPGDPGIAP